MNLHMYKGIEYDGIQSVDDEYSVDHPMISTDKAYFKRSSYLK